MNGILIISKEKEIRIMRYGYKFKKKSYIVLCGKSKFKRLLGRPTHLGQY